jgi:hypothetical protein
MRTRIDLHKPASRTETLLVLLTPSLAQLEDFHAHGFVQTVRQHGLPVDLLLAQPEAHQLMDNTLVHAMHTQLVQPAQMQGYHKIWLVGVSLGAFNALYYAATHAAQLAGMYLIAPYPGTGDVLAEINQADGAMAWFRGQSMQPEHERIWWAWLGRQALDGQ